MSISSVIKSSYQFEFSFNYSIEIIFPEMRNLWNKVVLVLSYMDPLVHYF